MKAAPILLSLCCVPLAAGLGWFSPRPETVAPHQVSAYSSPGSTCVLSPSGVVPRPSENASVETLNCLMGQTFIALNWPAAPDAGRGVALDPSDAGMLGTNLELPRVWQTWKQDWETVAESSDAGPTSWSSYATVSPPCDAVQYSDGGIHVVNSQNWPDIYKAQGGLLDELNLVGTGTGNNAFVLTGPNIDQNGHYYRYGTHFNQALYDCWTAGEGSGCKVWPDAGICMPAASKSQEGAISVKASWRQLSAQDIDAGRYFTREMLVLIPGDGGTRICREMTMGLAAMHVVYKNSQLGDARGCSCPEDGGTCGEREDKWMWATFEQPDAVPDCLGDAGFTVQATPVQCAPLPPNPQPVGECRVKAIPKRGGPADVNNGLATLPPPWNNYKLIASQWLIGGQPEPNAYVANVRLETFSQKDTCMGCHDPSPSTDRIWSLSKQGRSVGSNPCEVRNAQQAAGAGFNK